MLKRRGGWANVYSEVAVVVYHLVTLDSRLWLHRLRWVLRAVGAASTVSSPQHCHAFHSGIREKHPVKNVFGSSKKDRNSVGGNLFCLLKCDALAIKWLDAKEMVVSLFTFVPSATRGQMYNPCIRTDVVLAPLLPHYFQMYKNAHLRFTSLLKCEPKLPKILVFVCQFVQPWLEVRSYASSSTASAHFPFCQYADFCTWIHAFLYIWPQVLEWQAPRQKDQHVVLW